MPMTEPPLTRLQDAVDAAHDDLRAGRYQQAAHRLTRVSGLLAIQAEREAAADAIRRNGVSAYTQRLIAQTRRAEQEVNIPDIA